MEDITDENILQHLSLKHIRQKNLPVQQFVPMSYQVIFRGSLPYERHVYLICMRNNPQLLHYRISDTDR